MTMVRFVRVLTPTVPGCYLITSLLVIVTMTQCGPGVVTPMTTDGRPLKICSQ